MPPRFHSLSSCFVPTSRNANPGVSMISSRPARDSLDCLSKAGDALPRIRKRAPTRLSVDKYAQCRKQLRAPLHLIDHDQPPQRRERSYRLGQPLQR